MSSAPGTLVNVPSTYGGCHGSDQSVSAGVQAILVGEDQLQGVVELVGGSNVTLSRSGQKVTISFDGTVIPPVEDGDYGTFGNPLGDDDLGTFGSPAGGSFDYGGFS